MPVSPGGSLVILLPIASGALCLAAAAPPSRRLPALLIAGTVILLYLWHYVFYWFLEVHPYTRKRPGTCPRCATYNAPKPWST